VKDVHATMEIASNHHHDQTTINHNQRQYILRTNANQNRQWT